MLSQGQLLTEVGFLNLEGLFVSFLQLTMKTAETGIVLTYLFLNPEAQGCLGFGALFSFILDFGSECAGRRLIFGRLELLFLCILLWLFSRSLICLEF